MSANTGAAACCGGCEPMLADILDEELGQKPISSIAALRPLRLVKDTRAA